MENIELFIEQAKKAAEGHDFFPLPKNISGKYLFFKTLNMDYSLVADIKGYLILDKSIDAHRMAKVINDTLQAHPIYCAEVVERDGIAGFLMSDKSAPVEVKEMSDAEFPEYVQQFFSTLRDKDSALHQFQVISTPSNNYLLQKINHTISDLSSTYILTNEYVSRYEGKEVTPEEINMFEYIAYQDDYMKSEEVGQCCKEFDQLAAGYLTQPTPFEKRELVKTDVVIATKQELNTLRPMSKRLGVGVTNCIIAGLALAVMRLTKQDRLMMGNSYHGRYNNVLTHIHGCLAHTLPVMAKLPLSGRVDDYLAEFGQMQNLIMDKFISIMPYIQQKYTPAFTMGGSLNIRMNERPVMIDGTKATTVKKMGADPRLPFYASLDVEPDGWHLRCTSIRWSEEELKGLSDNIRTIILGMAEKELISEL